MTRAKDSLSHLPTPANPSVLKGVGDDFSFAHHLQTPVWVFDIDRHRVTHANAAACTLWRAEHEAELLAREFESGMSSTVQKRLKQYQSDFEDGAVFNEMWTLYPKGAPVSVQVHYSGFRLPDQRLALLCEGSYMQDDTPDNLRSADALLHTDVMISLFLRNGRPLYMNPAARNAAINSDQTFPDLFVDGRDHDILLFELDRRGEHSIVAKVYTAQGLRWHNLSAKVCTDAVTGDPALLVTANDVSELKNARDQARYLANRDQLTGCFNRSFLQQRVGELAEFRPKRCAILFFDVDRFKQINDRFGHEMGDCVLKTLADRTKSMIEKTDVLSRLGGDEFVILFEGISDEGSCEDIANQYLEALREPIHQNSTWLNPTVSMGLTFFTPGESSFTNVLSEADIALYASKVAGRNCLTVFNEALGAAAKERDRIEFDLKAAIEREEFVLYYQPRIDLASKRILSVEALVRWQHPERGLILPGDFISVCEETGLIEALGRIVLAAGLRQVQDWHDDGTHMSMSINISPTQFNDPLLMETLKEFASRPDFPAHRVELEITENVLIGNQELLARKLYDIAELGYRIAIDDFGVGYSNLSYISNFPVHCIKIDRSFIGQLPDSGPVVSLILTLARQIGATIVAEGVETLAQAGWLSKQNCDQAQGFLYYKPMPFQDLTAVLAADGRQGERTVG